MRSPILQQAVHREFETREDGGGGGGASQVTEVIQLARTQAGEFKAFVTNAKGEMTAMAARLDRLEGKANRQAEPGEATNPLLEQITKADGFTAMQTRGAKNSGKIAIASSLAMVRKGVLTSTQAGGSPNFGIDVPPTRYQGIGEDPRRRLTLLDTLPHLQVSSNAFEFVELSGYNNAAAEQSTEGAAKAEADLPTDLVSVRIATVAHWIKASRQVLDDWPMLQAYLNGLLGFGVMSKIEQLIVAGTGQIRGLNTEALLFGHTEATAPDRLSEAQADLEANGYEAGVTIMHPGNWHKIRTLKDTQGNYLAGSWNAPAGPNIWGSPVVRTPSTAVGISFVVDTNSTLILDRKQLTVELGFDADDFTKNLVTILAEARVGFAILNHGGTRKVQLP